MSDTTNETKTLRDEFAMRAMQSLVTIDWHSSKEIAHDSYTIADAMLDERAKRLHTTSLAIFHR